MIYLVMGQIGAGKSVMSKRLCEHLGAKHLALGSLLRNTYAGHPQLKHGKLMPDELVFKAVKDYIDQQGSAAIVVDGFPRNKHQEEWLNDYLMGNPDQYVKAVYVLEVSDKVVNKRLQLRARDDDTKEAIKERKKVFAEQVQPIIDYYGSREQVIHVNADKEVEEVFAEMLAKLPQ